MHTEHENLQRIQSLVYEFVDLEEDEERRGRLQADLASDTNWFGRMESIEEFVHGWDEEEIKGQFNWHAFLAQEYIDANPADPE